MKHDGASSSANSASQRTVLYLSPECLVGKNITRTTASDIWAFGITIAQVITSRIALIEIADVALVQVLKRSPEPWEGPMPTLHAVIQRVCEQKKRPAPPLQLRHPEESNAWEIAERCWEQEGARRLQASEVSGRLRRCAISANQMQ